MARKNRTDSASGAVRAFANAQAKLEPPSHVTLRDSDRPFFDAVVRARTADTWTANDLAHAANLAACQADIERLRHEVHAEGDIVENARGTQIVNPKHALIETLSRRAVTLSRTLHVHAEATVGRSSDQAKINKTTQAAAQMVEKHDTGDDGLIATPKAH